MGSQLGASRLRRELRRVEGAARELEFFLCLTDVLDLVEARNNLGDRLADAIRVLHRLPIDRASIAEDTARDAGNDFDLASWTNVPRRAAVTESDVVEHRFLRRRLRLLVASQHWQDDRLVGEAVRVAGVESRVEVHEHLHLLHRVLGKRGIGVRAIQIPAEAEAELQFLPRSGLNAGHRVEARCRRQLQAVLRLQPLENRVFQFRGHAHRADPLHVRVASNRQQSRVGAADHTSQQREVGDRFDVFDAIRMMRDPHRPSEDDVLGRGIASGDGLNCFGADTRLAVDVVPVLSGQTRLQLGPVIAVLGEERFVVSIHLHDSLRHSGQQREITSNVRLHVQRGNLRPEEEADRIARHAEVDESCFDDRVDDDDVAALAANVLERGHQSRMVARRVAADDEYEVRVIDILQHQRGRSRAENTVQPDAACLMAVKATVIDVVGAEDPREDLQQETGLVRAATAEVPEGLVGSDPLQLADDFGERLVPRDRLVVVVSLSVEQRLRQPAARFELPW